MAWLPSIRPMGGKLSAFLAFAGALLALSLLSGCARSPPRRPEIHVCARPPEIPEGVATWSISGSGALLWTQRELAMGRAHDSPLYIFDFDAPASSVKLLPIPYNHLKCPRRPSPPPRPPAAKKTVVARKAEAPATVSRVARREARCPNDPGQVRRTRSTGEACSAAEKSTAVGPRPAVRAGRVASRGGEDEPTPIDPPRPPDGPLQDWNVREPEVTGLSAERAMECLANLCHARHPGFAPKKKDGSGEAARPREGQSWSSGGQTGGGAGGVKPPKIDPTKTANEVLPGSLRREFPGQHLDKSLNQIKELLRTAHGEEKRSLQTAKKLLEQSERLLDKTRNK